MACNGVHLNGLMMVLRVSAMFSCSVKELHMCAIVPCLGCIGLLLPISDRIYGISNPPVSHFTSNLSYSGFLIFTCTYLKKNYLEETAKRALGL